jgi:hypothetical protein
LTHRHCAILLLAISSLACGTDAKRTDGSGGSGGGSDSSAPSSGPLSGAGPSSCSNLCDKTQTCNGAPQIDCDKECAELEATAVKAGCPDALDDLIACAEKQPDVCNTSGACSAENNAFIDCFGAYCQKNPTDPGCNSTSTSAASSTGAG